MRYSARLVDSAVLAGIEPTHPVIATSPHFIRIEFTSDQDMRAAAGASQLYVHAEYVRAMTSIGCW
jgi:hypothetical protein